MTPDLIENCPPFPWVLLLTRAQGITLLVVRNALELERQMMARDLQELRLLGLGGPADPVAEIIQRSDAAQHFLVTLAEKVGCECWGHLDLRHGAFEVVLWFRRNERPHLKVVSGEGAIRTGTTLQETFEGA